MNTDQTLIWSRVALANPLVMDGSVKRPLEKGGHSRFARQMLARLRLEARRIEEAALATTKEPWDEVQQH